MRKIHKIAAAFSVLALLVSFHVCGDFNVDNDTNICTAVSANEVSENDISFAEVTYTSSCTYGGIPRKPAVAVNFNGTQLKKDTDFTVSYANNINAGTAQIIIEGRGEYSGTVTKEFTILPRSLANCSLELSSYTRYFTGVRAKPVLTVKIGDTVVGTADYSTSYSDNLSVGTAKVTVTGRNNLKGTVVKKFTVLPRNIKNCTVVVDEENFDCESEDLKQYVSVAIGENSIYNGNYTVSCHNDYSAGTSALTIVGQKNLSGTIEKNIHISNICTDLETAENLAVTLGAESFTYSGSAITPSVKITLNGTALKKDTDFTVTYENNIDAGTAKVIINGIGYYKGTLTRDFEIKSKYIGGTTIEVDDSGLVFDGTEKKPEVILTFDGTILTENVDYQLAYLYNVNTSNQPTVSITGIGNFNSTVSKKFVIRARSAEDCIISGLEKSYEYTGSAIKPETLSVTLDGNVLRAGTDYSVSYSDNTAAGTASVTITGKMLLQGTVTETFDITPIDFSNSAVLTMGSSTLYYNGSELNPSCSLKLGEKTLVRDRDYTVTCENNVNVGTASVTIKGVGNYTGELHSSFEIAARNLSQTTVTIDDTNLVFDGTEKEPIVTITYNGNTLVQDTDYELSYLYNINTANSPKVVITGKGNYTGTLSRAFTIQPRSAEDCVISGYEESYQFCSAYIKPQLTVTLDGNTLRSGTDYTIAFSNNLNAGTATITLTGKMLLQGTVTKNFDITPIDISNVGSAGINSSTFYYTGEKITPAVTLLINEKTLKQDTDFTVSYADNINAGTGKITFTGIGNYTGTIEKTFEITPRYIGKGEIVIDDSSLVYNGSEQRPEVSVTYGGTVLTEGEDYTVSCTNNINATDHPLVYVNGIGNFNGNARYDFTIQPKPICQCVLPDDSYSFKYTGGYIRPFRDIFGSDQLKQGIDYTVFSYSDNIEIGRGSAVLQGKGNYTGSSTQIFNIRKDISKTNITGIDPKYKATGSQIKPDVKVSDGTELLVENTDYRLEYKNNIKAGTAEVDIIGLGDYMNTVSKTFEISENDVPEYSSVEFINTDEVLLNPHKGLLYYTGSKNGYQMNDFYQNNYGEYSNIGYARIYWYQVENTAPEYETDEDGNIKYDANNYPIIKKRNYDWTMIDNAIKSAAERNCTYALAVFPSVNPSASPETAGEALNENGNYYFAPYWLAESLGLQDTYFSSETRDCAGYLNDITNFGDMSAAYSGGEGSTAGGTVQWVPNWRNEYIRQLINDMINDFAQHLDLTPCGDGVLADYVEYVVIGTYGSYGIPTVDEIGSFDDFGLTDKELYSGYVEPFINAFKGENCSGVLKDITIVNAYANPTREQSGGIYDCIYDELISNRLAAMASYGVLAFDEAKGEVEDSVCSRADGFMPSVYEYIQKYAYLRDILLNPDRVGKDTTPEQRDKILMERMKTAVENGKPTYIELDAEMIDPSISTSSQEYSAMYKYLANRIGYYYRITDARYAVSGNTLDMKLTFRNDGVTKLYGSAEVCVGVFNEHGTFVAKYDTGIDASSWLSDTQYDCNVKIDLDDYKNGYKFAVGLFENKNDENPAYLLGSKSIYGVSDKWYMLG